jgi:RNase H-fold protein (predicted Holliday junction resolvase)
MNITLTKRRILALDVRARRIGYAAFEVPARLIDFGVTRFRSTSMAMLRLGRLIQTVRPATLIVRKIPLNSTRNVPGTRAILRLTWLVARRFSMHVSVIRKKQVGQYFSTRGAKTKYQVALSLVGMFPELEWKLPPPRKFWKGEHRNMSIFDAAALGITYLACTNDATLMKKHSRAT